MHLLPQDLPIDWHVKFAQARDNAAKAGAEAPTPRLGFLGRWLAEGSGLDEKRAAAVMPAMSQGSMGVMIPFSIWGGMMLMPALGLLIKGNVLGSLLCVFIGALLWSGGPLLSRLAFNRHLKRPVSAQEVDRLLGVTTDPAERQFLELVRDAVKQPLSPEAEENVKEALRGVAEAIARLPAIQRSPLDTDSLRAEAAELQQQAAAQEDRVIAESLQRRAAAILHRVEAHERSHLIVGRAEALRSEIEAQIAAMREGLAAFDAPSPDAGALAALAESARQVATEAATVADAREELERDASHWPATPAAEEPQQVRLGTG